MNPSSFDQASRRPSGACMRAFAAGLALCLVGAAALAQGSKKPLSCKLDSERIIQGKEKKCLYVCEDKSLEGRSRKPDSDCPKYINSANK